jgi:ABC-type sulfate/molybdate transport systems ATPase subunit
MGLAAFSKNYPDMLSGGQRQKLAIARMMSCNAEIALLDEPFAHLDPDNKAEVRRLVQEWIKKNKITFIMVTHDPLEDYSYFDSIAVMEKGGLRYQGSPEDMRYFFKCRNPENQVWLKL